MIRKILVATDGSDLSAKAVKYAADLAQQMGASITLLGVIDKSYLFAPSVHPAVSPGEIRESTVDLLRQAVQAYLDEAGAESESRRIQVMKVIRVGHPVEEIVRQAEYEQADLIVLGSHGRSAIRAAVLGSVAYGVLHHKETGIPVLIIRREDEKREVSSAA